MAGALPQPQPSSFPLSRVGFTPSHVVATAVTLRLLRCSSFPKLSTFGLLPRLKNAWCRTITQLNELNFLQLSKDTFHASCSSCLCFFSGRDSKNDVRAGGNLNFEKNRKNPLIKRRWTDILLAMNVLVYFAQIATRGKLILWGAKINPLIDQGQWWRLATSSLLHANIAHLMVNCYSLNSVGPTVESLSGPKRFLAVYFSSAIASSAMSYWFCKAPAVGASGAISGLVGSVGVFIMRHRRLVGGGKDDLQHIARVIVLNMVIGLLSKGIDNWGHVGGLLGGAATSWFLGPAWEYETSIPDGRRAFIDRAPIFYLVNKKQTPKQFN